MKTKRVLQNTISCFISYFITALAAFLLQRVFKNVLGKEYLGINSLYANIMSGLSIVELGFGSAIIANMYKPVAEQDIPMITALVQFYKKVYRIVAIVILGIGFCILPFINYIVGETTIAINTKLIFLFYLLDVVVSYFLTYKRSMLYANQQSYYVTWIHTIVLVITNFLQICFLYMTESLYIYLLISILFRMIENIIINMMVDKRFPYLKTSQAYQLGDEMKSDIKRKVHGLIFHKIATFVVFGTDNILISMVPGLGIIWVGVYSSYSMITRKLTGLLDSVFNSITASVGNLLLEKDSEKSYRMFCNIHFLVTWVYVFVGTAFFFVSFPFIELWMGKDFVLDRITVFVISFNMFFGGLRVSYGTFKTAAGIFFEDRYVPLAESLVNFILSVLLARSMGLKGVIIGTICSDLVLYLYSYPRYVYHNLFKKGMGVYIRDLLKSIFWFFLSFSLTAVCMRSVFTERASYQLVFAIVISISVPNFAMFLINARTDEWKYYKELLHKVLSKNCKFL